MHKTGFAYNWRLLNANLLLFKPKALGNQEELLQSVLTDVKPPMQVLNYLAKRWCKQRLQSSHGGGGVNKTTQYLLLLYQFNILPK